MKVGIGYANEPDPLLSATRVIGEAVETGGISRPGLAIAFCGGQLDPDAYLKGLQSHLGMDVPVIGGSAIGVITNEHLSYRGYPATAAVLELNGIQCVVVSQTGLNGNERQTGRKLAEGLPDHTSDGLLFILYDSLKIPAGGDIPPVLNASAPLIEGIEGALRPYVPVFGAGLISDYGFAKSTSQFCGTFSATGSAAALLLSGNFQYYYRIMHGCSPLDGVYRKITKMSGSAIYELDGRPVVEIIDGLYGSGDWHHQHPVDLLTIGVNHGRRFGVPEEGSYVNRLITGILPDGKGIGMFEPDLEPGMEIQFMLRDGKKMIESARKNATELMAQVQANGKKARFGIYIDCAGRTGDYSNTPIEEAGEIQHVLNKHGTPLVGFYSGVEIAPFLHKSRGLDWTGVLLVLAE